MSAFTRMNAADRSGSAGRPETSNATASASVVPNESAIASQVQPTRKPNRTAAARKREKKRMSGRPSWADECRPGSGKAMLRASKTCGWFLTISFVGPRATEKLSTGMIRTATRTIHERARGHGKLARPGAPERESEQDEDERERHEAKADEGDVAPLG